MVDDGSTDDTADLAVAAGAVVLRRPKRGQGAARNAGARAAAAELLAFLDADDRFTPGRLARMVGVIYGDPAIDGVLGATRAFISPDRLEELRGRVRCPDEPQHGGVVGALLVRRSVFVASGGFDEALAGAEAIDWFDRMRTAGFRFAPIRDVVLERRIHNDNMTRVDPAARRAYVQVARSALLRRRAREPGSDSR